MPLLLVALVMVLPRFGQVKDCAQHFRSLPSELHPSLTQSNGIYLNYSRHSCCKQVHYLNLRAVRIFAHLREERLLDPKLRLFACLFRILRSVLPGFPGGQGTSDDERYTVDSLNLRRQRNRIAAWRMSRVKGKNTHVFSICLCHSARLFVTVNSDVIN